MKLCLKQLYCVLPRSVVVVVEREVERRRRGGDPHSDLEKELLERLGKEAGQWAEQAELLVTRVLKENTERPPVTESSAKVRKFSRLGILCPSGVYYAMLVWSMSMCVCVDVCVCFVLRGSASFSLSTWPSVLLLLS